MVEHTYWTPLVETPNAPSGLHHAPGNTVPVESLGITVLRGGVPLLGIVGDIGEADDGIPDIGRQDAICKPTQRDCNTLRIRPYSLRSIDNPHRALMEIQFPR